MYDLDAAKDEYELLFNYIVATLYDLESTGFSILKGK